MLLDSFLATQKSLRCSYNLAGSWGSLRRARRTMFLVTRHLRRNHAHVLLLYAGPGHTPKNRGPTLNELRVYSAVLSKITNPWKRIMLRCALLLKARWTLISRKREIRERDPNHMCGVEAGYSRTAFLRGDPIPHLFLKQ